MRANRAFVRDALRRLRIPPERLDDAEQDVFVVLAHTYRRIEPQRGVRGWLWGIARRVAWAHRRDRRARLSANEPVVNELAAVPATLAIESSIAVRMAIGSIDADCRQAFVLADIEGRTAREIATLLHVPVTTAQWRIRSARRKLRDFIHRVGAKTSGMVSAPSRILRTLVHGLGGHTTNFAPLPTLASGVLSVALVFPMTAEAVEAVRGPSPGHGNDLGREVSIAAFRHIPPCFETISEKAHPMITSLTFTALLITAPVSPETCDGDDCTDADSAAYRGRRGTTSVYDFENDKVEGEVLSPVGFQIHGPHQRRRQSLLRIRPHFIPELVRLSDDL